MIVRFRLDAALYEPAPQPISGQKGRPRKKGKRLPTLETIAGDPHTQWQKVVVPNWYGQRNREVEIVSDTAVWYHSGKPTVPIRWARCGYASAGGRHVDVVVADRIIGQNLEPESRFNNLGVDPVPGDPVVVGHPAARGDPQLVEDLA